MVVLSVGAIAINGLNLGIDFEGGTQITLQTPQPVALEDVRAQAAERAGEGTAQIQGAGTELAGGRYEEFRIRTDAHDRPSRRP